MRPACRPLPSPNRRHSGRGFTMIELMVVIVIIAILIGLLLPAIGSVQGRVRVTQVQTQLAQLASAVVSFKNKYGIQPPSFIRIPETGGANGGNWDTRSKAIIRQLWPQFAFAKADGTTYNRDVNGDGDFTDTIVLEPGECLVFFLGGLPTKTTSGFTLAGLSSLPTDPFVSMNTTTGNPNAKRDKSSYDFDASRLVDLDSDGMPEFLDPFPGQQSPILYYSSYDGNGYRSADFPGLNYGNPPPPAYNKTIPVRWYSQGSNATGQAFNKSSYQLISPGPDGQYGPGGPYAPDTGVPLPEYTEPVSGLMILETDRNTERDNITNFSSGKLVP